MFNFFYSALRRRTANKACICRQATIRAIEAETNSRLISYVSGINADLSRDDTLGFVGMLSHVAHGSSVDLLLHTPGGDIDVAEKVVTLLREKAGEHGVLRVIVPDFAKSAGTLVALGADKIVMSDSSELGTIDPQVNLRDGDGNEAVHSVLHYLNAYDALEERVRNNQTDLAARLMLEKFHPATVNKLRGAKDRTREFAENLLKRRVGLNFSLVVHDDLMNIDRYKSHSQPLGWELIKNLGLDVQYLSQMDQLWQLYWNLYCALRLAINDDQKIFESSDASLVMTR